MTRITVHTFNRATSTHVLAVESVETDAPESQQDWQAKPQWAGTEADFYAGDPNAYVAPGSVTWDGSTVSVWRNFAGVWLDMTMDVTQGWYGIALNPSISSYDFAKSRKIRVKVNNPSFGSNSWDIEADAPIEYSVTGGEGNDCELWITLTGQIELTQDERTALYRVTLPTSGEGRLFGRIVCPLSVGDPTPDIERALGIKLLAPKYFWGTWGEGPSRYLVPGAAGQGFDGWYAGRFDGKQEIGEISFDEITQDGETRTIYFSIVNLPPNIPFNLETSPDIGAWSSVPASSLNCVEIPEVTRCGYGIELEPTASLDGLMANQEANIQLHAVGGWWAFSIVDQLDLPRTLPNDWEGEGLIRAPSIKDKLVIGATFNSLPLNDAQKVLVEKHLRARNVVRGGRLGPMRRPG